MGGRAVVRVVAVREAGGLGEEEGTDVAFFRGALVAASYVATGPGAWAEVKEGAGREWIEVWWECWIKRLYC